VRNLPAKSGNDENSIEKETNDSSTGELAFSAGFRDNGTEHNACWRIAKAARRKKVK
jgi:hypothetical protein